MEFEKPVIIGGDQQAEAAVIWLHGLGADGYDFEPVIPLLSLPRDERIRFILPHARVQPVTLNGGMACRSWFDIFTLEEIGNEDIAGMNETNAYIRRLIQQQMDLGIDSKKIFLVGFSQGGAMALYTGLRYELPLGGILGLSTLLGGSIELTHQRNPANAETPIFLAHGVADMVISLSSGLQSKQQLENWGYNVTWKEYHMGHEVCPQELKDVSQFLTSASRISNM